MAVEATAPRELDPVARFEATRADYLRYKRFYTVLFWVGFLACLTLAIVQTGFDIFKIIEALPRSSSFIVKSYSALSWDNFWHDLKDWYWGFGKWFDALLVSLMMAFTATVVGTTVGGLLSFIASRNLAKNYWLYFVTRRILEIARTVPDIVWALIFIYPFGVGPLAGVLALIVHTTGAQGKLFSEVNENVDEKPIEGIRASGGDWFEEIRFAVVPQVLPNFISYTFWRLALNVQAATVMGFVSAGGIGYELITAIRLLYFLDVGAILLMVIGTVFLIDMASEKMRHYFIGKETLLH
ncbi:MAG: phosphonate ABC transporter, permease protein PhnE [Gammaproteobacteria bacterium]|nr:phosphonate ABC transporter, permease protein PhnE [Gammaproteobacteria bacterium]